MKAKRQPLFYGAIHLFLLRGDEILLLLRQNTGWGDGQYGVVAGHLDGGENVTTAMIREAREEAGIDIRREDLIFAGIINRRNHDANKAEYMDFFFACRTWSGEITNTEPHKCGELKFFPLDALPPNTVPYIRKAIENFRANKLFDEHGWG